MPVLLRAVCTVNGIPRKVFSRKGSGRSQMETGSGIWVRLSTFGGGERGSVKNVFFFKYLKKLAKRAFVKATKILYHQF